MGSKILDVTVVSMENKFINVIHHIKFVSKREISIDHILANLRKSDEGKWEIGRLMTSLSDMVTNNLLELTDGTYIVKETDFVEEIQISSHADDLPILKLKKWLSLKHKSPFV